MTVSLNSFEKAGGSRSLADRWLRSRPDCLFNPMVDFMCLGGGSLFFVIPFLFLRSDALTPTLTVVFMWVAHVVNNPHFAHSYQLFYRNFREKAFGETYPALLRARYLVAGLGVPLALALFFAAALWSGSGRIMGYGANVMFFFVGWHYVKQGYGMIVLDSVLKKNFFPVRDKNVLLTNAYVCWLFDWIVANRVISEEDYLGLSYYTYGFPTAVVVLSGVAAAATTIAALFVISRRAHAMERFPLNGVIAYVVSIYVWLLLVNFSLNAFIGVAAFHSLQYLVVVWRYQLNVETHPRGAAQSAAGSRYGRLVSGARGRVMKFVAVGIALGVFYFWIIPVGLSVIVPYDKLEFGDLVFAFMFWVFINVHHYFLDSVTWRRDNPDIGKYLFAAR